MVAAFEARAGQLYGKTGSARASDASIVKRGNDRDAADRVAVAGEDMALGDRFVAGRAPRRNEPARPAFRPCRRPAGDAGDRDRDVGAGAGERAGRHGARHRIAHRAVAQQGIPRHAQHLALGLVGVGDEGAVDDVRRAGDRRQGRGDQAAGAGLGGDDLQLRLRQACRTRSAASLISWIEHAQPLSRSAVSTVATACAAMPSPRPVKPSPSVVVAFTLTRSTADAGDARDAFDHRRRDAGRCAAPRRSA